MNLQITFRAWRMFFCILGLVLSYGTSRAAGGDDLWEKLRQQFSDYVQKQPGTSDPDSLNHRLTVDFAVNFQRTITDGDPRRLQQFLAQVMLQPNLPNDLKDTILQVQEHLPELIAEYGQKFVAQTDAIIEKTRKDCLTAKVEKDLDPLLGELGQLRKARGGDGSPLIDRASMKIDAAIQFVARWQDYLAQKGAGNIASATRILQGLANDETKYPILSQEEIQLLLPKEEEESAAGPNVRDVLREIKSLDDIPMGLKKMEQMERVEQIKQENGSVRMVRSGTPGNVRVPIAYPEAGAGAAANYLRVLANAVEGEKQGFYNQALGDSLRGNGVQNTIPNWMPEITRLRGMFVNLLLPKYLAPGMNLKPTAGENAGDFLLRLAGIEKAAKHWSGVQQVLEVYRQVSFGNGINVPPWLSVDIANCRDFVAAQNYEKAGHLINAIIAYERVLKRSGNFSPSTEAEDRIKFLHKLHPEAFGVLLQQAEDAESNSELKQSIVETQQTRGPATARGLTPNGR